MKEGIDDAMGGPPSVPNLPRPLKRMSYRDVRSAETLGVEAYYFTSLQYGHYLWKAGHAGRAILALTRALYADLPETAEILKDWPLPYAAIRWMVAQHPSHDFPGNPRISFQHQATRMRGVERERQRVRAWAVWYLVCDAKPSLEGDPKQEVEKPDLEAIEAGLRRSGHGNEAAIWRGALRGGPGD